MWALGGGAGGRDLLKFHQALAEALEAKFSVTEVPDVMPSVARLHGNAPAL